MEEVLRRMYKIKQRNIQRRRIEKALEDEHYLLAERKKYDFREDSTMHTPRTNLPIDDEIRFEKELTDVTARNMLVSFTLPTQNEHLRLPMLSKREPCRPIRRKFRGAVWAVVFLLRLQQKNRENMLRRKRKAEKCYKNLLIFVERLLRSYFERELREELTTYVHILEERLEHPEREMEEETARMLYAMSEKLSASTVTKDMLQFFVQAATRHSFPPADFLTAMEISRLEFSPKYGCLSEVSMEQTKMVVALGLGVKIFCFYLLCQPWRLGMATEILIKHAPSLKEAVCNVSSVFYFPLIEEFCFKLKEVRNAKKSQLASFGIRPIAQLDPFGDTPKEPNTSKQLIIGQNRTYLSRLELKFPQLCAGIKTNLGKWISRITHACLKESTYKCRKKEEPLYYRTIEQQEKQQAVKERPERRPYRSLEMERGRQPSSERVSHVLPLPSLKRTLD